MTIVTYLVWYSKFSKGLIISKYLDYFFEKSDNSFDAGLYFLSDNSSVISMSIKIFMPWLNFWIWMTSYSTKDVW